MGKRSARITLQMKTSENSVTLKLSEVLESAFDFYYSEYITAWALGETHFNKIGETVLVDKKSGRWVGWDSVDPRLRPDVATLLDLMPDLPSDKEYREIMRGLKAKGVADAENYFWESIFTYKHAEEINVEGKRYLIKWEA